MLALWRYVLPTLSACADVLEVENRRGRVLRDEAERYLLRAIQGFAAGTRESTRSTT